MKVTCRTNPFALESRVHPGMLERARCDPACSLRRAIIILRMG